MRAYATNGNAFTMITKQAVFAAIGLVAFWACQRLPARTFRALGRPVLGVAIVLLVVLNILVVYDAFAGPALGALAVRAPATSPNEQQSAVS